ncbi:tryptophan synthase subunit alpha [Bacillus sp. 2205SS5-2]|uniref:tryptophan synthase subunit alpha n=1 Tax=Bacillus sp. 2205SS5-2 TaxID=3109031 RepID=UPI003006684A
MHDLTKHLQLILKRNEKLFIPYIMAGDGGLDSLQEKIAYLERVGASAIEIGVPFSDPVADGPTIQNAGIRALQNGTTLTGVIEKLKEIQDGISVPIILMSYLNPIVVYGIEQFSKDIIEAGVSGLIVPDMPQEESGLLESIVRSEEICLIQLVSLTSPNERLEKLATQSQGFLYAVTVTGITGERRTFTPRVFDFLDRLKSISPVPVLAGFGISSREQMDEMNERCDGVIVGSKIVQSFHEETLSEIDQFSPRQKMKS